MRRAAGRAENTIRLELALVSHLFEIARKEWGMESLLNPLKNIRMASHQRPISRRASAKAVEELVKNAMLPVYSTWLVPLNEGNARLLAPFEPFLDQLRELGSRAAPDEHFRRRLREYVVLYRAAVKALAEVEREERQRFQQTRDDLIRALLCMRAHLLTVDRLEGDEQMRRLSRQAALRGAKFLKVVCELKSLHVHVRPAPRDIAAEWAQALFPAPGIDGTLDFGSLFSWLSMNADAGDVDLHSVIALYRELTGDSWWALADPAHGDRLPPANAKWELVGLYPTSSATTIEEYVDSMPWELSPPEDFSEVREGDPAGYYTGSRRVPATIHFRDDLPRDELRFIRHLRRIVGDGKLRAMLLFVMAERWHFEDNSDETQSDFGDRVFALCRWVKDLYPGRRTLKFESMLAAVGFDMESGAKNAEIGAIHLKRLINELSRCGVRRPVELNLDIPTPIPGRKQYRYAKRRKVKAKKQRSRAKRRSQ